MDDAAPAKRAGGQPAPLAIAGILEGLIDAINGGDTVVLRKFIVEHFAEEPGAPSVDVRLERFSGTHDRLGALTIEGMDVFPDGPAEISLKSAVQGRAMLRVLIDRTAPYKIHSMQIQLGGN
jgi:hypothetical protein